MYVIYVCTTNDWITHTYDVCSTYLYYTHTIPIVNTKRLLTSHYHWLWGFQNHLQIEKFQWDEPRKYSIEDVMQQCIYILEWFTNYVNSHFFQFIVYLFKFLFLQILNILKDHVFESWEFYSTYFPLAVLL